MENTSTTYTPSPVSTPVQSGGASNNNKKAIIIFVVIVLALIAVIFYLRQPKTTKKAESITPTESREPSPTEKPEIDKDTVKIQVQNGTGTPGQAGKAVTLIKGAGYKEDNIKTANADEFGDTTTTVKAKEGFEDVANDIKDALEKEFDKVVIDSVAVDEDSDYDIIVVTGGNKYEDKEEEPAATTAPNPTATPAVTATTAPTETATP